MTVRDCFFRPCIPPLEQRFRFYLSLSFVTKFSFSFTKYYLKSEELCLFEPYEDGQDISCRSMMFGASRILWEALFVFSTKTEYLEDGVVRFLILSFFYQSRLAHHWNPDIPEDNEQLSFIPRFRLLLLLSRKGAVFF